MAAHPATIRSATSGFGSVSQFPSSFVPPSRMVSPCGNMYTIHGGSGSRLMRNSSMPGLAAMTTCPRTGTTAGIGHQVVGGGAGAVDDDRSGAGQAGQRGDRGDLERAARPLEPGAQVVQVDGHGRQRRGVVPAAGEAVRQFGLLAVAQVGQEPGPVVRLERGAGDLPAGRQPHPGAGFGGELGQDLEPDPAPLQDPVRRADLHRAPDRPGRHRRGLRGQRGRPDRHAEPGLGQADRRGEADGPGPDYENVHEPTVSRRLCGDISGAC